MPAAAPCGGDLVDARQVVGRQRHVQRADVLFQILCGAWCRGWARCRRPAPAPRRGRVARRAALLAGDVLDAGAPDPGSCWKFSPWKRGERRRKSSSAKSSNRLDLAGQEAAPQGAVGDEADAEFAAGRQNLVFGVAAPQRIFGLQGGDGVDGARRGGWLRARPRTGPDSAPCPLSPARPSRRPCLQWACPGPRGADSTGQCGPRRAAAGWRRRPAGRTPACR